MPGGGPDAFLFGALAVLVACCLHFSSLSAVFVLVAGALVEGVVFPFNLGRWARFRPSHFRSNQPLDKALASCRGRGGNGYKHAGAGCLPAFPSAARPAACQRANPTPITAPIHPSAPPQAGQRLHTVAGHRPPRNLLLRGEGWAWRQRTQRGREESGERRCVVQCASCAAMGRAGAAPHMPQPPDRHSAGHTPAAAHMCRLQVDVGPALPSPQFLPPLLLDTALSIDYFLFKKVCGD